MRSGRNKEYQYTKAKGRGRVCRLFEVFNVRKLGDFVVPSRRVFSLVLPPKEYFM